MIRVLAIGLAVLLPSFLTAQTAIDLGGLTADPSAAVEVTADSLSVDQESGTAVFAGNVKIGQGDLRLQAARVEVVYAEETGDIARLLASGGVTFATAAEAAEAQAADYDLQSGKLTLSGDVLLTQGSSALSAERMEIDLQNGRAVMSGQVRTIFAQDGN